MIITVTLNPALDKTIYIEKMKLGDVNKIEKTMVDPGGKGINVSKVLKNLKNSSVAMGFLGGNHGEILRESLHEQGIEAMFTQVEANTRMNIKIIEEISGSTTDLNEKGEKISSDELVAFISLFKKKVNKGDLVVFSGSVPRGIPSDIYYTLSQYAIGKGAKVFLDATGDLLKEALKSKIFLIKPNREELEDALGLQLDSQEKILEECKKLLKEKVSYICLSMGAQGAMLLGEKFILKAKVPKVAVKSTVGAGDSLLGGLASYIDKGYSIEEAFRIGVAASVVAVTKEGTKAPSLSEINSVVDEITISKEEF